MEQVVLLDGSVVLTQKEFQEALELGIEVR